MGPILHPLPLALGFEMRRQNQMPPSNFPSCARLAAYGPGQRQNRSPAPFVSLSGLVPEPSLLRGVALFGT